MSGKRQKFIPNSRSCQQIKLIRRTAPGSIPFCFLRGSSRRERFQQNSSAGIARLLNAKERGQRWRDFHGAGGLEMAPWSNARSHHNQWHVSASYNRGSMSAFKTCPEATAASASFA